MPCLVPLNSRNYKAFYLFQEDCGVLPANPVFKQISTTGGSPVLSRDTLQSAELDGSSEVTGIRNGSAVVNMELAFELKYAVHDDLIEAVMQNEWVAGTTLAGEDVVIDASAKTATITGKDLTASIAVNDRIVMPSLTGGNARPMLVTAIAFGADTVITFGSAKIANPQISQVGLADETATTDIKVSDKITVGTTQKQLAILIEYSDIPGDDKYQLIMDSEVTQFSFNPSVNANITGTFTIVGKTLASAQPLPAGATLDPLTAKKPMTGIDGSLAEDGVRVAFAESMNYTLNRAGEPSYELGSEFLSFIDYGKTTNELSITSKFVDYTTAVKFESIVQPDISFNFTSAYDGDCLGFTWPSCILTGVSNTVGEGTIPQELTVIPYKPAGTQSSLIIHRVSAN